VINDDHEIISLDDMATSADPEKRKVAQFVFGCVNSICSIGDAFEIDPGVGISCIVSAAP